MNAHTLSLVALSALAPGLGIGVATAQPCATERDCAQEAAVVRAAVDHVGACKRGSAMACNNVGQMATAAGRWARARRFFERACRAGSGRACRSMGRLLERGRGGARDPELASHYHRWACDLRVARSCVASDRYERRQRARDRVLAKAPTTSPRPAARAHPISAGQLPPDTWTHQGEARRRKKAVSPTSMTNVGATIRRLNATDLGSFGFEHTRYHRSHRRYGARIGVGSARAANATTGARLLELEPSVGHVFSADRGWVRHKRRLHTWTVGASGLVMHSSLAGFGDATKVGGLGFIEFARHTGYNLRRSQRTRFQLRLRGGYITDIGSGFDAFASYSMRLVGLGFGLGSFGGASSFDVRFYLAL